MILGKNALYQREVYVSMSIRARSYSSNKKDGAREESNESEKSRATCEMAEEGPRAKRSKEGHRRPNGKWEARYRPKSRIKLHIDPMAYRGFDSDRGLHKYEWLAYFETKRQKDEYIVAKKVLFKEAYDRAKNGILQVPTTQSSHAQIPTTKRPRSIQSESARPIDLSLIPKEMQCTWGLPNWTPIDDKAGPSNPDSFDSKFDSKYVNHSDANISPNKGREDETSFQADMKMPIEAAELLLSLKR
mmetsp:Transcript_60184/g.82508  ORF Transcript_60184/g.82508 Transcript_60184/m.82508 type:complete len:245 (-) Transcript_60184:997-1731(-)